MRFIFRLALLVLASALCGSVLIAADEPAANLKIGSLRVGKVLILGNSITLHPPVPSESLGNWGMAASVADKDYVHLLLARMETAAQGKPQSHVMNIADFERQHATWDLAGGVKEVATGLPIPPEFQQPDLIILAIGENVPSLDTPEAQEVYRKAFTNLMKALDHPGHPTFVVRSCFWANPPKDQIMRDVCEKAGGHYVDLKGLDQDKRNFAHSERKFENAGVGGHPGDRGMQAIADTIWKELLKISAAK